MKETRNDDGGRQNQQPSETFAGAPQDVRGLLERASL